MGIGSRTVLARWAQRAVLDHAVRVTEGLPDRFAHDRFDQVVSDVWEQAAASDHAGRSGLELALRLVGRTLRGLPADLWWRWEVLREQPAPQRTPARPLAIVRPFDQTNGLIVLERPVEEQPDDLWRLWANAVALNAVNVGMVGGNL